MRSLRLAPIPSGIVKPLLLQRYAWCQFFLRLLVLASWVALSKLSLVDSFYHQHEYVNLALATGLAAACLAVSGFNLFGFLWRVLKVFRAKQHWYCTALAVFAGNASTFTKSLPAQVTLSFSLCCRNTMQPFCNLWGAVSCINSLAS